MLKVLKPTPRLSVENYVFLTFSTDFSTKNNAAARVFNCPKKFLLPFCNHWLQSKYVEIAIS